jgi:hypothetical protein
MRGCERSLTALFYGREEKTLKIGNGRAKMTVKRLRPSADVAGCWNEPRNLSTTDEVLQDGKA